MEPYQDQPLLFPGEEPGDDWAATKPVVDMRALPPIRGADQADAAAGHQDSPPPPGDEDVDPAENAEEPLQEELPPLPVDVLPLPRQDEDVPMGEHHALPSPFLMSALPLPPTGTSPLGLPPIPLPILTPPTPPAPVAVVLPPPADPLVAQPPPLVPHSPSSPASEDGQQVPADIEGGKEEIAQAIGQSADSGLPQSTNLEPGSSEAPPPLFNRPGLSSPPLAGPATPQALAPTSNATAELMAGPEQPELEPPPHPTAQPEGAVPSQAASTQVVDPSQAGEQEVPMDLGSENEGQI